MASNLPVLRRGRRGELVAKAAEEQAFQKAVAGVAKSFLAGNAAQMPGLSSVGGASSAMLARVTQDLAASFNRTPSDVELALAEQGLSWGPPFPPGRPLDPFWGHRRPARTWDYSVGENVQVTPRWGRISFPTLKAIIEAYDVAQICIRHLTNDVRSLDYQFVPPNNIAEDATEDVEAAERFFATPDKRQPFRAWLAEWLQDVLRYDAGSLYIRRNEAGDPIALEVVNGTTIIPIIDFYGRIAADEDDTLAEAGGLWPGDTVPAYVQIIQGMPFNWLAAEDIIYQPWNPMPDSQYGLAPMEAVLLSANTDIRFQFHFLQYFTEGTIPQGFMEAPPDMSDPAQVEEWQSTWDALMVGDQSKLRQIRWVPAGAKYAAIKDTKFDSAFPLYLMRRVAASFGVTPNDLGFTEDVNRSCYSADTEVLTEQGWKHYWEVSDSESIATYNPDTQAIEYHVPDELHVYPYEGEMVHFSSTNVDVLVTPEHRMWVGSRAQEAERNRAVVMSGLTAALEARQAGKRNASGWSISAICRRLEISRTTWRQAAAGERVRPETAEAIRDLLPEVTFEEVAPDWLAWRKREAHELESGGAFWFVDRAAWDGGEEIDTFVLPAVEAQSHWRPDRSISMDLWLEFLGYVISEGCVFRADDERYVVTVSQSESANPDKVRVIDACLGQLPIAFRKRVDAEGMADWRVSDKALWTWLSENIGHLSGDKRLPTFFRSLGKRQLDILLEALMLGDGTVDPRANATNRTYFTKSHQLADEVQEVALRLGNRAQIGWGGGVYRVNMAAPRALGYTLSPQRNVSREMYSGNVWCYHVKNHIFLTRRNGRIAFAMNTGDTQIDVQFRVGTLPLVRHVEDIINLFITEHLKLKARIQFDIGREVEDRLATAQAEEVYIRMGVLSPDEVRQRLGKRTSRERPTPRFIDNTRSGPIPVLALDSLGGKVDPSTFGPAKDQPNLDHPFVSVPGVAPVISSTEYGASQNATANMQRNMLVQNEDDAAPGVQVYGDGRVQDKPGLPVPAATDDPKPETDKKPAADKKATKALTDALSIIDLLLDKVEKTGWDNTGGPGVTRGTENPVTLGELEDDDDEDDAEKEATAGITAATGIEGSGLIAPNEDGEDDDEKLNKAIRRWRDNTRNRVRKNLAPKRFVDPSLPDPLADAIWDRLRAAGTRDQVDAIFKDWRTLADPTALVHKRALELLQPDIDRLVASAARVDSAREALIARGQDDS